MTFVFRCVGTLDSAKTLVERREGVRERERATFWFGVSIKSLISLSTLEKNFPLDGKKQNSNSKPSMSMTNVM